MSRPIGNNKNRMPANLGSRRDDNAPANLERTAVRTAKKKKKVSSLRAKKAYLARLKAQQARQSAVVFRRTVMPILLTLGGLLIMMGVVVLVVSAGYDPAKVEPGEENLLKENKWLFATFSFFLGGVFTAAGVFFMVEIIKMKKYTKALLEAQEDLENHEQTHQ